MIIYILLFLSILICFFLKNVKPNLKKIMDNLFFIILFLFSALRFDVGADYYSYYKVASGDTNPIFIFLYENFEFSNKRLIDLARFLNEPQLYFIMTSFIINYCIINTLKKNSKNYFFSIMLYLSIPLFYFNSLGIIRQYCAIAIVFYSIQFIKNKNLMKFIICIVLAVSFHRSALIAAPLYLIYRIKSNKKIYILLLLGGFVSSGILLYLVGKIFPMYLGYLTSKLGEGGNKLIILFNALGILCIFCFKYIKKKSSETDFYLNTLFIGIFIFNSMNKFGQVGTRGALYYIIFTLLLIPELIEVFKHKKIMKSIGFYLIFILYGFSLYLGIKNPKKNPYMPYRIFFMTDKQIFK